VRRENVGWEWEDDDDDDADDDDDDDDDDDEVVTKNQETKLSSKAVTSQSIRAWK
jgi:hypothetical protein